MDDKQTLRRQVLENKAYAKQQEEAGAAVYSTQEILGSILPVKDFARFFTDHKVDLQLIRMTLIDDFTSEDFTPDGKRCFGLALDCFYRFFETAQDDLDRYALENQKKENTK